MSVLARPEFLPGGCSEPDTDISGIGVRISFYCQVFLYAVLANIVDYNNKHEASPSSAGLGPKNTLGCPGVPLLPDVLCVAPTSETSKRKSKESVQNSSVQLATGCTEVGSNLEASVSVGTGEQDKDVEDACSSLMTLIVTNVAMQITGFLLTSDKLYKMSFVEALAVSYLLGLSSECIILSLPCSRRDKRTSNGCTTTYVRALAYVQSYGFTAYSLLLFYYPSAFGGSECVDSVQMAIFTCVPFNGYGIFWGKTVVIVAAVIKAVAVYISFAPQPASWIRFHKKITSHRSYKPFKMFLVLTLWSISVTNTELLLQCNGVDPTVQWDFGQILPLVLLVEPAFHVLRHFSIIIWKTAIKRRDRNSQERKMEDLMMRNVVILN